jgi:ATP-dependent Clp protease ATP-binding subunit ClpC
MPDTFDRFTEQARRALKLAEEEAHRHRHCYIGTEHLLLGVMAEPRGIAAQAVAELGLGLEGARQEMQRIVGQGEQPGSTDIGLTPRAKQAIVASVNEANRLRHGYVGTEHLLLGLMSDEHSVCVQICESLGAAPADVRRAVERRISPN